MWLLPRGPLDGMTAVSRGQDEDAREGEGYRKSA